MGGFGPWPGGPGGGSGGGGFFADIYDAGVADSPSVDNLMTGTLQQFFINLGATPPPFPPTNPLFFPEAALAVGENPADSGIGADSKPLWRMRRWFSTFPSIGDQIHHETRYDLFGSGVNSITGGDRSLHVLVDQFENRLTFEMDVSQLTRPGLFAPNISPIYLDGSPVSYKTWVLLDALGSGNTNDWHISSDGNLFRRALIPNTIGGGGGPAGPWSLNANEISIWSRNGGEPLIGSTLFYDVATVQTFGVDDVLADQHTIVAQAAVLDDKNLGSGQAAGHGQTWIRSTLGGPAVLVASWFDDVVDFPVEILVHQASVVIGGFTVDGVTSTTGTINCGGDLNVGSGDTHLGQDVTMGALLREEDSLADAQDLTCLAPPSEPSVALQPLEFEGYVITDVATPATFTLQPNSEATFQQSALEETGAASSDTTQADLRIATQADSGYVWFRGRLTAGGAAPTGVGGWFFTLEGWRLDGAGNRFRFHCTGEWVNTDPITEVTIHASAGNAILAGSWLRLRAVRP